MNDSSARESTASLMLRLVLAIVFLLHGSQKLFGVLGGRGFAGTVQGFHQGLQVPLPIAWLGAVTEFVTAVLLLAVLLTRVAAAWLLGFMLVATYLGGHLEHGFFMNWSGRQDGEGVEYNLCLMVMCLAVFVLGGGTWSLDAKLRRLGR